MKIIVCVKQVLDTNFTLEIDPANKRAKQVGLPRFRSKPIFTINPADNAAFGEALALKEEFDAEITAITVGTDRSENALRHCLTRGADRAIHLQYPPKNQMDAWGLSQILSREIAKHDFGLILCGDKSLDNAAGQVGPFLAELLHIPQVTRVIKLELDATKTQLIAQRLLERGDRQVVECQLPALLTVTEFANEPPFVANIRCQRVPDELIERHTLSSDEMPAPLFQVQKITPPRPRPKKMAQPAAEMSAAERMRFMMMGGAKKKKVKESNIFEGEPSAAAERIIKFLREKEIL